MTALLTEARTDLAAVLTTALVALPGVTVHDHIPEDLTGLDVALEYTIDALTPDHQGLDLSAEYLATFEVHALVSGVGNRQVHLSLDDLLSAIVPALTTSPSWEILPGSLTRITSLQTSEWTAYGVSLAARAHLTPQE